ncbi:hypothetical protein HCX48_12870 [Rhodocyclus tenuis]|uniref:Outer membrane lipoprotein Blc n=1 Tax=Rhodocyclus gracilis TaxID=2929842 RepID=A0ABX0WNG8_9RHOO|nr:lipocalin family protein [Rhodocyclus gracilis]NJA90105.1 hypothetical protein [Rhodocyclus gracilis]
MNPGPLCRQAIILAGVLLCLTPAAARADDETPAPVQAVPAVDLARYLGKWYEIARFPLFFQRVCVGDTTAEYGQRADGDISVTNRCRTEEGFSQIVGRAWAVEGSANARLKVQFFWPFRADYWVIGLADDYRWAVVGNPNRRYLWILSRTPTLPAEQLAAAEAAARAQGFDLRQLSYTHQSGDTAALKGAQDNADTSAPSPAKGTDTPR